MSRLERDLHELREGTARSRRGRELLAYQQRLALAQREDEEQRDRRRRYAEAAGE